MQAPFGPQILFLIPRPVDPASFSCKHPSAHKPYFSCQFFERMPRPIDPRSFSCKYSSAHKPYFSYHVPSTQVYSYAIVLRPTNFIFHPIFSSACYVPSTHVHSHASILRPTNLIFIPTSRAHATSLRSRFILMQASIEL